MNQREREEFLLAHGTEMERHAIKAIKARRQAEQAQAKQSKT